MVFFHAEHASGTKLAHWKFNRAKEQNFRRLEVMLYLLCYLKQNNESHVCDMDVGLLKPCSWLSIVVRDKTHLHTCDTKFAISKGTDLVILVAFLWRINTNFLTSHFNKMLCWETCKYSGGCHFTLNALADQADPKCQRSSDAITPDDQNNTVLWQVRGILRTLKLKYLTICNKPQC